MNIDSLEGVVLVRPVRPGDGAGCARAWLDAGRYYTRQDPQTFQIPAEDGLADWFEQIHARAAAGTLQLVGCIDNDVAGLVTATLRTPAPDPHRQLLRELRHPSVYVQALAVAEAYRRRGVATALMRGVEEWAADQGAAIVSLDTSIDSPLSVPFYDRQGYTRSALIFRKLI